jgi:pteridine reductase
VSRAHWARMQRINLEAPMFLTQGLLPCLQRAPAGCIVAITDVAGSRPIRRHSAYCVSKAGLAMLVSALAIELAPLRVNGVAPGAVAFPDDYDPHKRARILARVPLAREGSVADIAQAVRFVVQAPYVTGQIIAVDGGRHAGL